MQLNSHRYKYSLDYVSNTCSSNNVNSNDGFIPWDDGKNIRHRTAKHNGRH